MAKKEDNLMPIQEVNARKTPEERKESARNAGIASGKARREKASLKKAIKWLLEESDIRITQGDIYETYKKQGIDISELTPGQLATIGLWAGAVTGKNENYKTLLEGNNELIESKDTVTPDVEIKVIENKDLEKIMYEDND